MRSTFGRFARKERPLLILANWKSAKFSMTCTRTEVDSSRRSAWAFQKQLLMYNNKRDSNMKHLCTKILLAMLMSMMGINAFAYNIMVKNADGVTIYYNYINDGNELEVAQS